MNPPAPAGFTPQPLLAGVVEKSEERGFVATEEEVNPIVGVVRERPLPETERFAKRHPSGEITSPVIPAKAGIHFDFFPGEAATTLLSRGVRMRNSENSPFVFMFDSDPPRPGVKMSEQEGKKAKAKMDSGFRRNDGKTTPPHPE